MSNILNVSYKEHDVNFAINLSGNILDMEKEDVLREIRYAFDQELSGSCEYMVDFSISDDQDRVHEIIEKSKEIIREINDDKELQAKGDAEINKAYQDRLQQYLMYEYRDGRDDTNMLAHDMASSITVGQDDDADLLEDIIDDNFFTAIRDEIMFAIEFDLDKNLTINDLIDNIDTEFMYLPDYSTSRSVVENDSLTFDHNHVAVENLRMDEGVARFFSMINVSPAAFADHLKTIGKDDEVVENYRQLTGVVISSERNGLLSMEDIVTVIENSYTCAYPTVFAKVSLSNFLDRDITKSFFLKQPLVGLHDFVNGAGYLDRASGGFEILPNDFDFTGGKAYRYEVDDVYGYSSDWIKTTIEQPLLAAKYHESVGEEGLLGVVYAELQTKKAFENYYWAKPALVDKEHGHLMRDGSGGTQHLKALDNLDAKVLCAIHNEAKRVYAATSSVEQNAIFGTLSTIETKFAPNVARLKSLGLVESWVSDRNSFLDTTYAGKVFQKFESERIAAMENHAQVPLFGPEPGSMTF